MVEAISIGREDDIFDNTQGRFLIDNGICTRKMKIGLVNYI